MIAVKSLMFIAFVAAAALSAGAVPFEIVSSKGATQILISRNDFKVVRIAAEAFSGDVEAVSGRRPKVITGSGPVNVIIAGTVGSNEVIDQLVRNGRISVREIANKRESYVLAVIDRPMNGVRRALVIAGSDRRGTAYGIFKLSEMIGVSPWVWWADVAPVRRARITLDVARTASKEPAVRYRGIFINDEDWGFRPWAAKTFEPEVGNLGPKTYAKVFELLLRLKANTCWPAMHEVTKPFNEIAGNAQTADDYAIVMGTSHAEPMLRNNVGEWKLPKDRYNFLTSEKEVTEYWSERARTNGRFESIFTIGMRGIHDSPIQGPKTQPERISLLERIFGVQRALLESNTKKPAADVPQIFCPYKEVLADYRAGLKVPDDVTIVFPDDNFGYIRYFPSAGERKRAGGFGVYYHISYLGRPLSYLWLNSTPPALIFEEMSKAYANGMDRFWMLNAGDIKPAEIGVEYFMRLANDPNDPVLRDQRAFLEDWAGREFGREFGSGIADVMDRYFRLGYQRKPEHLQWYLPGETPRPSDLNRFEIGERLAGYEKLLEDVERLRILLPQSKQTAFEELVRYPVRSAAHANMEFFLTELAADKRNLADPQFKRWLDTHRDVKTVIERDTREFNETLAGGKWRGIMSREMGPGQWLNMRSTLPESDLKNLEIPPEPRRSAITKAKPSLGSWPMFFIDIRNVISIEAYHWLGMQWRDGFGWREINGLGRSGHAISLTPFESVSFADRPLFAPAASYALSTSKSADYDVDVYFVPTHPLVAGGGLRVALSIDEGPPVIITADNNSEVGGKQWSQNVLNSVTIGSGRISIAKGDHSLKLLAIDAGVAIDKIVLRSGPLEPSYFGPRETGVYRIQ